MLTIARLHATVIDADDADLTPTDFTGPGAGDRIIGLLAEHDGALASTTDGVAIAVAGRRLLHEDGTAAFELAASVHRIEPGLVRGFDLIVCDLDDGLPGLTATGSALVDEALDAIADLVNTAFADTETLLTTGRA
ncbi:hypothetical protein Br6_04848 [Rhodococcus sp. Br-6]|nr:hypothetical protein Br6_04848 [Rhodococcus sp. Br-6]